MSRRVLLAFCCVLFGALTTALHVSPLTTGSWLLSMFIYFSPFLIILIGVMAGWRHRTNSILLICVLIWSIALLVLQEIGPEPDALPVAIYFLVKPIVYLVGCAVAAIIGFLIAKITQAKS